jgi:pimeloyl-ACP methyl ester carboxylesterase
MTSYAADLAETRYVQTPDARLGYRRFGPAGGVPLVLLARFRATLDHWDPALLDVLAGEREVIVFDNLGTGLSSGDAPDSVDGLAAGAVGLIRALGLSRVDVLGWSMGGFVAQAVALREPGLVRRLVVAGSGPGGLPDQPASPDKVWQVAGKPVNDDEDFLYLFFPETEAARAAGLASLRRLDTRLAESHAVVAPDAVKAQLVAIRSFAGFWDRLAELTLPVLVANGAHDVMVAAYASYAMSQRLPNAKVVLYSDAGHGFLFQHSEEFGREVLRFLS